MNSSVHRATRRRPWRYGASSAWKVLQWTILGAPGALLDGVTSGLMSEKTLHMLTTPIPPQKVASQMDLSSSIRRGLRVHEPNLELSRWRDCLDGFGAAPHHPGWRQGVLRAALVPERSSTLDCAGGCDLLTMPHAVACESDKRMEPTEPRASQGLFPNLASPLSTFKARLQTASPLRAAFRCLLPLCSRRIHLRQ
jgi:hypothetical protein